jgi:hypothetical protein
VVNQTDWDPAAKDVVLLVIVAIWLVSIRWFTIWPFLN